jgi:rubredoxin
MARYECVICGFRYDEEPGRAEQDIAPDTPWEELPADWCCPDCGGRREEFIRLEN